MTLREWFFGLQPKATEGLEGLVAQSQHLRDFLRRTKGGDSVAVTKALIPFEKAALSDATEKQVLTLTEAFQSSYAQVSELADERTVINILRGQSPYTHAGSRLTNFLLVVIGIIVVGAAFHFTLWSNKANTSLQTSERFIDFSHFDAVIKAIEIDRMMVDQASENAVTSRVNPDMVYLQQISTLKYQYQIEKTLPSDMQALYINFNPIVKITQSVQRSSCAAEMPSSNGAAEPQDGANRSILSVSIQVSSEFLLRWICPSSTLVRSPSLGGVASAAGASDTLAEGQTTPNVGGAEVTRNEDTLGAIGGVGQVSDPVVPASATQERKVDSTRELILQIQKEAGRRVLTDYEHSRFAVENFQRKLGEQLNIVRYWALPIIYGALGAFVYSIWRVLTPSVSSLGFWVPILRMVFGALAALTFSMIFIPANVISFGLGSQTPIVYLLSFIFGYSVEGFIRILNVFNAYIASNTTIGPRKRPT